MSFQRRMATLPWPLILLVGLAVGAAGIAFAQFVFGGPDGLSLWPLGYVLVGIAAVVSTVVAVVRRRRLREQGRFEAVVAAGEAVRTGRLPTDPAARAEVVRMMPQQRALLPLFRWGGPLLFGLLALLQLVPALDYRPRAWLGVAFFAALAVSYVLQYRRLRPRLDALEEQLRVPR